MASADPRGYLPGDPRYGLSGDTLRQYYREKPAQWVIFAWDKPGQASAQSGNITVDVNALLYAFGLPLYVALVLAAREPGWMRKLALGYAVIMPFVAWGVLADFLKNVAITPGPLVASQTGFSAWQREAIVFAFQMGTLILPTVVPAVTWVIAHRQFLERLRGRMEEASR